MESTYFFYDSNTGDLFPLTSHHWNGIGPMPYVVALEIYRDRIRDNGALRLLHNITPDEDEI